MVKDGDLRRCDPSMRKLFVTTNNSKLYDGSSIQAERGGDEAINEETDVHRAHWSRSIAKSPMTCGPQQCLAVKYVK
jgi:hypothetical protein